MDAQRVREVRIGGSERRDRVEQIDQRAADAAAFDRNPQHAERRAAKQRKAFERQFAARLALRGVAPDLGYEFRQCSERGTQRVARFGAMTGIHSAVPLPGKRRPHARLREPSTQPAGGTEKYRDASATREKPISALVMPASGMRMRARYDRPECQKWPASPSSIGLPFSTMFDTISTSWILLGLTNHRNARGTENSVDSGHHTSVPPSSS
ncbi:hypothetical protein ACVK00_006543 [Burkholderia sp. PvR073]